MLSVSFDKPATSWEAQRQLSRAENVLVDWQKTQENIPILQAAAEKDDQPSLSSNPPSSKSGAGSNSRTSAALIKLQDSTLAVIQAATASANASSSERRAIVLHNTANWVDDLLNEWTCSPTELSRNSGEPTADPKETSDVVTEYKKQVAELEKRLASMREENVSQIDDTRTQELVLTSLEAQRKMDLLRDDLTRRVKTFEQAQYSGLKDLQRDYNLLAKALKQELPKKLDEIQFPTSHLQLVHQRKSLSQCARELRKSLDEDFAWQRSNLIAREIDDEDGQYQRPLSSGRPDSSTKRQEYKPSYGNNKFPFFAVSSGSESDKEEQLPSVPPPTSAKVSKKLPPVIIPIRISPEVIGKGGTEIIKSYRRTYIGRMEDRFEFYAPKMFTINIQPYHKYGKTFIFPGMGDELDDGRAPDLHFVLSTGHDAYAEKAKRVPETIKELERMRWSPSHKKPYYAPDATADGV